MTRPSTRTSLRHPRRGFAPTAIALAIALACSPARATLDIPNAPLQSAAAIPSNILFILDDSGSMQFEFGYPIAHSCSASISTTRATLTPLRELGSKVLAR